MSFQKRREREREKEKAREREKAPLAPQPAPSTHAVTSGLKVPPFFLSSHLESVGERERGLAQP